MLYYLLYPLRDVIAGFNVFRYITFRRRWRRSPRCSSPSSSGPWLIRAAAPPSSRPVHPRGRAAVAPDEGRHADHGRPPHHLRHRHPDPALGRPLATPTSGSCSSSPLAFGAIGFVDDYRKLAKKRNLGLTGESKFGSQFARRRSPSGSPCWSCRARASNFNPTVDLPLLQAAGARPRIPLHPVRRLVLVGASNAVNLTDGLDGLAIGSTLIAAATYTDPHLRRRQRASIADYLRIAWVPRAGELAVFCGAMVGASLGFLWFNAHPAEIFMGDVGSLALGGAIGCLAVIDQAGDPARAGRRPLRLEALSVIIQVASFKLTRQARLQDVAAPPSLRALGLGGAEGHRPLLDHRRSSSRCSSLSTLKLR